MSGSRRLIRDLRRAHRRQHVEALAPPRDVSARPFIVSSSPVTNGRSRSFSAIKVAIVERQVPRLRRHVGIGGGPRRRRSGSSSSRSFSSAKWKSTGAAWPAAASARGLSGRFALGEHGAERERDAPGEAGNRHRRREHAVAVPLCGRDAFGTGGGDDERHLDRVARRRSPSGCSIWSSPPSHSTCSPRSSAFSVST